MDLIDAMHIKGRTIKKISNYINLGEGYRSNKYTLHIYFHHKCVLLLLLLLFQFLLFLHLTNIAINNNHFFVTFFSTFVYLMFSQMLRVILWQMFWHFTRNTKVRFIIRSNGFIAITRRKKNNPRSRSLGLKMFEEMVVHDWFEIVVFDHNKVCTVCTEGMCCNQSRENQQIAKQWFSVMLF